MLLTSPPTKKSKYPHGASGFLSGEEGEMINSGRGQAVDPNPLCVLVYYSSCWHYEFGSYNSTGFIGENATEFDFFSPLPAESGVDDSSLCEEDGSKKSPVTIKFLTRPSCRVVEEGEES
uniref:Uncharacterized protein n=1 Tax=Brassica oleracea TaxID=3712 RepID=A0A3P6GUV6_BRAOL|nr:unnamed protein product [Brassica oleracea]